MTSPVGEELSPRQQEVLLAIVKEYVQTGTPVGSGTIQREHELAVSAATIRNDMVRLSEQGYLSQPHTSAGRVPTEKAYRFHISCLAASHLPSIPEVSWIRSQYRRAALDTDSILRTATKVLAQVTQQPALTVSLSGHRLPYFTKIQATPVSAHAVRISCSRSDGSSQELVVKSCRPLTAEQIRELDQALVKQLTGTSITDAGHLETLYEQKTVSVSVALLRAIAAGLARGWRGNVYVDGTASLLDYPEFQQQERLRGVMQMLDEEDAVHQLLCPLGKTSQVTVVIGSEHRNPALAQCSLVAKGFRGPSPGQGPGGTLGVLGPMRLPYGRVMSVVSYIADHAGQILSQQAQANQRN